MLTAARLRELIVYDPDTGVFRNRVERRHHAPVGSVAGTAMPDGRRTIMIDGRRYYANVLAWLYMTGEWPTSIVDHRDNDPGNNRWSNFRLATRRGNAANSRVRRLSRTGFKGAGVHRSGKFQASIHVGGRKIYLGLFATAEEASAAYMAAAIRAFGPFARAR